VVGVAQVPSEEHQRRLGLEHVLQRGAGIERLTHVPVAHSEHKASTPAWTCLGSSKVATSGQELEGLLVTRVLLHSVTEQRTLSGHKARAAQPTHRRAPGAGLLRGRQQGVM